MGSDSCNSEADSVTAIDYLQQQTQLEDQAREIFNKSIDKCTYTLGAIRQNLFACQTCETKGFKNGICYACSIRCHGKHQLIEVNNKRGFQCDCGTDRLGSAICEIRGSHDKFSPENKYDQNFTGIFCICKAMYTETDDLMFQCLVCEDWFHEGCIKKTMQDMENPSIPDESLFDLFVCAECMKKISWLSKYRSLDTFNPRCPSRLDSETLKRKADADIDAQDRKKQILVSNSITKQTCKWSQLEAEISIRPLFLQEDFREELCLCDKCTELYKYYPMLLEEGEIYEPPEDNASDIKSLLDAGEKALNTIPREKAIEGVMAYNKLKDELSNFLRPYAENGQVVSKQDVERFFDEKNK